MDRSQWLLPVLFAGLAVLFSVTLFGRLSADNSGLAFPSASPLPADLSARAYAAIVAEAVANSDGARAAEAARAEVAAAPWSVEAHHRLALASTLEAGAPTREALGALLQSYEIAPYRPPVDMIWRVEFAAQYYSAMPEPVITASLSQIEALGQIPETFSVRRTWCKDFPDGALAEAACTSVPGINRNR